MAAGKLHGLYQRLYLIQNSSPIFSNPMTTVNYLRTSLPAWRTPPEPLRTAVIGVLTGEGIGLEIISVTLALLEQLKAHTSRCFELRQGGRIGKDALERVDIAAVRKNIGGMYFGEWVQRSNASGGGACASPSNRVVCRLSAHCGKKKLNTWRNPVRFRWISWG